MEKHSSIFIAGHKGLVGSAIYRALQEKGFVNIITRSINELDLTDQKATNDFFSTFRPEYVFLAAAKVGGIAAINTFRADFMFNNLEIQNNVIYSSWKFGVKKLLFLGSTCIYPKNAKQPLSEFSLLSSELERTNEPYALAKISGIKLCESFNIQYNTNFISVMPTNLYGPNDNYDLDNSHVLPALIRKFHLCKCIEDKNWSGIEKDIKRYPLPGISGEFNMDAIINYLIGKGITVSENKDGNLKNEVEISVWGTGAALREFMYVDDLAAACVFVMERIEINNLTDAHRDKIRDKNINPPHFLNIGTEEEISIKDLAIKIKQLTGFQGRINFDTSKPDGTPRKTTDSSLLHSLGFKHKTNLDTGLKLTYDDYLLYKSRQ